jgi:hypothetical protein
MAGSVRMTLRVVPSFQPMGRPGTTRVGAVAPATAFEPLGSIPVSGRVSFRTARKVAEERRRVGPII